MKRSWLIALGIIGVALLLFVLPVLGSYNGLVKSRETVRAAMNELQSQYQRRADLVPQLVATVKGSAGFEQETLTKVVEARAKATSITIDPSKSTPEQIQQYQQAQGELGSALSRLLMVTENYPQLRSTDAFRDLMSQLEGTENRIQAARRDYGKIAQSYNTSIQSFPTNIAAGLFGFTAAPYFTADPGAEKAPKVDFSKPQTQTTPAPAQ